MSDFRARHDAILGRLVRTLLDADFVVEVQEEGDLGQVMVYLMRDSRQKHADGWIKLQLQNDGGSIFSDHSTGPLGLDKVVKDLGDLADKMAE